MRFFPINGKRLQLFWEKTREGNWKIKWPFFELFEDGIRAIWLTQVNFQMLVILHEVFHGPNCFLLYIIKIIIHIKKQSFYKCLHCWSSLLKRHINCSMVWRIQYFYSAITESYRVSEIELFAKAVSGAADLGRR